MVSRRRDTIPPYNPRIILLMNLLRLRDDQAWLDEVTDWVDESLAAHGVIRQGAPQEVRVMPWSAVYRFATDRNDVYFKACGPSQAHEPALAAWLAAARPDCMIPVWAADAARGWYLMPDGGPTLTSAIAAGGDEAAHWHRVLALQAAVQRDVMPAADELLAMGVLDRRTGRLPGLFAALLAQPARLLVGEPNALTPADVTRLRALHPRLTAIGDELAASGPPDTFIHDDFHEDHIFAARRPDGAWRYVFFDFGDACIGHPFMQLVSQPRFASNRFGIEVDPVQEMLREKYLSHWGDFGPRATRQRALDLALIAGCVIRALTWVNACGAFLDEIPTDLRHAYRSRLAFWLMQIAARIGRLDDQ